MPIAAVVFDLAGVLLDFQGVESTARMSGGNVDVQQFNQFWASPVADALYTGRCTPDEFATGAVETLNLPIAPEEFLREFRAWLRGPYDGALELVSRVRARAIVACLSNTNSLDVARFRNELGFDRRFDHSFYSNEIGHRKPDLACYALVLDRLGLAATPERVVFFDDNVDCVEGALAAGMKAYQVTTVPALRAQLASLGLLEPDGSP